MILRPWMYTILSMCYTAVGILYTPNLWLTAVFLGFGAVCMWMCFGATRHYQRNKS